MHHKQAGCECDPIECGVHVNCPLERAGLQTTIPTGGINRSNHQPYLDWDRLKDPLTCRDNAYRLASLVQEYGDGLAQTLPAVNS
jgi:hypothetical protein